MKTEKIVYAIEERARWLERKKELEAELESLPETGRELEKRSIMAKLKRSRQQVDYYNHLERDMKRDMRPPRLSQLLQGLLVGK